MLLIGYFWLVQEEGEEENALVENKGYPSQPLMFQLGLWLRLTKTEQTIFFFTPLGFDHISSWLASR